MTLVEINKGRSLTLPAEIRRKYALKPGSRLELKEKDGEIVLTPLNANEENIFELIDKNTQAISDRELSEIKKKARYHALVH